MDEDMRIALATSLFEKALRVNGLSRRQHYITGDLPTTIVNFQGYMPNIMFIIHEHGWISGETEGGWELRLDGSDESFLDSYREISALLDEQKSKAEKILQKAVAADA